MSINLVVILGPTASGKTRLAALLAKDLGGEIISADSRQVYRGLNLGTGKDYSDYLVGGELIPHHLIDIVDPDYEFSVFDYQERFFSCFADIRSRERLPILAGGTGLYIEAVLKGYRMVKVPINHALRAGLSEADEDILIRKLKELNSNLHNTTDMQGRERLYRAIEIAMYSQEHGNDATACPTPLKPLLIGLRWERSVLRRRITQRLKERLAAGMMDEVQLLHDSGSCSWEKMNYFGLEYRYAALCHQGKISYQEMFQQLNTRIHQFAKRQETWFRRMERQGAMIHWLDEPNHEKLQQQVQGLYP